jgi:hypothetical protein
MSGNLDKNTLVVSTQLAWVRVLRYCELSGDTKGAVLDRRNKGLWIEGLHCQMGPDKKLWINLLEVERWVQMGNACLPNRLKSLRVSKRAIQRPVVR